MQKSDSIKELAGAMCKAQGELKAAEMNSVNPFLKNKYADLGSIIESLRPVLVKHGLSFAQTLTNAESGFIGVTTVIMHQSGEWLSDTICLPLADSKGKSLAQEAGSMFTYLRRYALASAFGVYADEDTDGNGNAAQAQKSQPKQEPKQAQEFTVKTAGLVKIADGRTLSQLSADDLNKVYKSSSANVTADIRKAAGVLLGLE